MARKPMKIEVKKGAMHKDIGKKPGEKITEADIKKEASKGPLGKKRAQFAENAKKWDHSKGGKK